MPPKCPVCSSYRIKYMEDYGETWECGCGYAIAKTLKLNKGSNQK
jgi:hypothetical protein